MKLAQRIQAVKPSPTLAVTELAGRLRAQGKDVIGLGSGEPDFNTPKFIRNAAAVAIEEGKTRYTAADGVVELKQAVQEKFVRENNLRYALNEIAVSSGAKQCLFNLMQVLLNPGDEVIIPIPYWVSYPDMALLAGAKPVFVRTDRASNYKMTAEQLESAITKNTKLLIINSPSNPSGQVYSKAELQRFSEVLEKHPHVWIVSDDIYEHILWSKEPFCNIAQISPALKSRTVVVNGVSKAYAMTGWRIGYIAGDVDIISAIKKIQSQSTSNPTAVSQYAALAALTGGLEVVQNMCAVFLERHQLVNEGLNAIPGISCLPSQGTFYAFADVSVAMQKLGMKDDVAFSSYLLQDVGVALVPGSAFGLAGHVRLSYATSTELLDKAINRLHRALA